MTSRFLPMPKMTVEGLKKELNGGDYDPGDIFYFRLGGKALHPDYIEPRENPESYLSFLPKAPKDKGKYIQKLRDFLDTHKKALARDIERYIDVITRGEAALSQYDLMMGYGIPTCLSLKTAHISFNRVMIQIAEAKLLEIEGPAKPTQLLFW